MTAVAADATPRSIDTGGLRLLVAVLQAQDYTVIGPAVADGAIVLRPLTPDEPLPTGVRDTQAPGHYRLHQTETAAVFDHNAPAQPWKRWLWPPRERLWRAERHGDDVRFVADAPSPPRYALFGVRACDLAAIAVLDRVFAAAGAGGHAYLARRNDALIVAVNCTRAGGTCFCASMGSGPAVGPGADIVLTETPDRGLAEASSARGAALLAALDWPQAPAADIAAARAAVARAAQAMPRAMPADIASLLPARREHPAWTSLGERCLGCGNCTAVCPTCFCVRFEDAGEPDDETAARWRAWDSCFTLAFTELHGGAIRRARGARYRQWLTHKLSTWWQQFGTSGCVGCGRCITWCPVGIDITREAAALACDATGG